MRVFEISTISAGLTATAVALMSIGILREKDRLYMLRVQKTSKRYHALCALNSCCVFDESLEECYRLQEIVHSKAQFDRFNFDQYFLKRVEDEYDECRRIIECTLSNRSLFEWYQNEVDWLPSEATKEEAKRYRVPYKHYIKRERILCERIVRATVTSPNILCVVTYRSPQGRNSYRREMLYTFEDLVNAHLQVKKQIDLRNIGYYQRKKMTDSIRYDVLKRDGFKCVLCGRSAQDGVKLHVDHILPVSKGGKTEMSNLRTLCQTCNMGKRDKYDESGWN